MLSRAKPDFFKKALIYLLLFISLAVLLSPLILIFLTSIKDQSQIYDLNAGILPTSITFLIT